MKKKRFKELLLLMGFEHKDDPKVGIMISNEYRIIFLSQTSEHLVSIVPKNLTGFANKWDATKRFHQYKDAYLCLMDTFND